MLDDEVDVLIVGGGPAGLTALLWLEQQDVRAHLIERRDFSQHFPRAHLLNVRTMEIFHDVGVADAVYAASAPERGWRRVAWYTSLAGPTPLHGRKIGEIPAWGGADDEARYAIASPRRFTNLPQVHLDRLLAEHAMRRCPGRVHPRHELTGLHADSSGANVEVTNLVTGQTRRVHARYVVAADGGRTSTDLLGVTMNGSRSLVDVVSLYVRMDLSEYADDEALLTYFVNPDSAATVPGALLALSPGPFARDSPEWSLSIKYRVDDPARHDLDAALTGLRNMLGLPDIPMEVKAVGRWQYEGVVADRFRVGSVFLVGDAAHRHPPTGGLGLNTAVQDAANLAWKLAAVLKDEAPESLLETYEAERLPVSSFNVEHALRNAGRHAPIGQAMGLRSGQSVEDGWAEIAVWASDTPEGARRRASVAAAIAHNAEDYSQLNVEAGFSYRSGAIIDDGTAPPRGHDSPTEFVPTARAGHHIPHAWLRRNEHVSTVDLVARSGLTVFAGAQWHIAVAAARAAVGTPITFVQLGDDPADRDFAAQCEIVAGGALLVRPDKHVAWRVCAPPTDAPRDLCRAVRTILAGAASSTAASLGEYRARQRGIADAGDVLRTGHTEQSYVFESR